MTETPADPSRRPLNVFDSSADGFTPYTLGQTVQAARDVIEALARFEEALKGCRTPLKLWRFTNRGREAREAAEDWVAVLSEAQEIIELDLPISDTFPKEINEDWPQEDMTPWNGENGRDTLSPEHIVSLRAEASALPIGRLTSYRREIEKHAPVPPFIRLHRRQKMRAAWLASLTDEERKALKAESRPERLRRYREFSVASRGAVSMPFPRSDTDCPETA